jgi:anthranilate/para-aminobenzoate synthase component II
MLSLWGIIAGVAAVMAIIVTLLVVGVCLGISALSGVFGGQRDSAQEADGRHARPPYAGSGQAGAPGRSAAARYGDR